MKLIVVDTETGGLNPAEDALLQLSAVVIDGKTITDFINLDNLPSAKSINFGALAVNKRHKKLCWHRENQDITPETSHPTPKEAFINFIGEHNRPDTYIVGHNLPFDIAFIETWLKEGNYAGLAELFHNRKVDTCNMLVQRNLEALANEKDKVYPSVALDKVSNNPDVLAMRNKLVADNSALQKHLSGGIGSHDALYDAVTTGALLLCLLRI